MKRWNARLRRLESRHVFSHEDAHDVVRLISEAAHQHVPEAQHALLVNVYARIVEEAFRWKDWTSEKGLAQLIEALLSATLTRCSLAQRRGIRESLNTLQQGEFYE